jgi:hypothetical protein
MARTSLEDMVWMQRRDVAKTNVLNLIWSRDRPSSFYIL